MIQKKIKECCTYLRKVIIEQSTAAGSGHPTSSLSGVELMIGLLVSGAFKYNIKHPENTTNDRLIFSKGHASPLFYGVWHILGAINYEELMTFRKFGSRLEGHPTKEFEHTVVPTGSLGQGLSVGVGIALHNQYIDQGSHKTYVLLGDSELAEGQVWEAVQSAAYYKLNSLVAIVDINRLGQRGETMVGHDINVYKKRFQAFGWKVYCVDGHNVRHIEKIYKKINHSKGTQPHVILAKTLKGKGISFLENKDGWHGKALNTEQAKEALQELGDVEKLTIALPEPKLSKPRKKGVKKVTWSKIKAPMMSTRQVYGKSLSILKKNGYDIVSLDAEVSNSTFAQEFKEQYPERFFEMFIAEQHMVSAAVGLATCGKIPFVSTFAAFLSRAYDQVRMSQYAEVPICYVGSHAGVSIGEDGASQMALEDIGFFRALHGSVVLYPSDPYAMQAACYLAANNQGISYIRVTRASTPVIYTATTQFTIGGSHCLKTSKQDEVVIFCAGIAVHEALQAYEELKKKGVMVRVVDLYSIKPIDTKSIRKHMKTVGKGIVVEDHREEGGIGEAVIKVGKEYGIIDQLAVKKVPRSGTPQELLAWCAIDTQAIVKSVLRLIK